MKIIWNGHSCFTIQCKEGTIVLDPYEDNSVPGLTPLQLKANLILCSHNHYDHNAVQVVEKLENKDFNIHSIDTYHDHHNGAHRGQNKVYIINSEDMKIVHLGDIGCDFDTSQINHCDVLMIPIGGHYTIDSKEAIELIKKIQPRIIIPMHYKSDTFGFDVLSTLDTFVSLSDNVQYSKENNITITKDTPSQTVILTYKAD